MRRTCALLAVLLLVSCTVRSSGLPTLNAGGTAAIDRMFQAAVDEADMADAILRNIYRGREDMTRNAKILARYVFSAREYLKLSNPAHGVLDFGALNPTSA